MAGTRKRVKKDDKEKFAPRKFILTVGDDGAILVYMQGNKVLRRVYAPSASPQDRKVFEELFKVDNKSPVFLLMDVMDQSYVQQSLPPVSAFSIKKLINRRLERDFPAEDVKGAIPLGRSREGRKDWNFLFVSLANIPPASEWIDFVTGLPNPLKGIYLLPVESQDFVKKLFAVQAKGLDKKAGEWQLLVSHNKVGGFRQVVLRDGKLVFTRLAQPIGEAIPEVIAGNIEQEIQNTVEYLKRLGFRDDSELDLFIIVAEDIKNVVDVANIKTNTVHLLTPYEVSESLGIRNAALPQDHYGDIVLAANFGLQRKHQLKLTTRQSQQLDIFFSVSRLSRVAAAAMIPLAFLFFVYMGYDIYILHKDISFAERQQREAQAQLATAKQTSAALPHDMEKVNDVMEIYEILSAGSHSPLPMVADFGTAMHTDSLVKQFKWTATSYRPTKLTTPARPTEVLMQFDMEFYTGGNKDVDAFLATTEAFFERLQGKFEAFEVEYSKLPGTAENEVFETSFDEGLPQQQTQLEDIVPVQVSLRGPKQEDNRRGGRRR